LMGLLAAAERARAFSGWAFDDLDVSYPDGREPWDYEGECRERLPAGGRVLDLGTGGGEVFARIVAGIAAQAAASEEWRVNAPVAYRRLRPLGVPVVRADSRRLPFGAGVFDTVLSRHEAIAPAEVDRMLAPGGLFVTQQVFDSWQELRPFFPRQTVHPPHEREYREWFEAAGYAVTSRECRYRSVFATLEELVFNLLVAPWEIPGLDVEEDLDALLALERGLRTGRGIELTEGRYLLVAMKPG